MTTYIIRGSHANEYELQNYTQLAKSRDIKVITTHHTLTPLSLSTVKLWSPADLPSFPFKRQILNRLFGGGQWLLGLKNIINDDDILHTAETYTPYTHQAVQLRREKKIKKLICTCWETIPHNNEKFSLFRSWKKDAYRYVDLFHTPTHLAKTALVKEGVNPSKIIVIPYGVNKKNFAKKTHNSKVNKLTVLTAGRYIPEKGIKIWQQLVDSAHDEFNFVWATKIRYTDMPKLYQKADIFLLLSQPTPTWEEQYAMVLVEAMSAGLPIIATRAGAIPEVLAGAGVLVDPFDLKGVMVALNRLANDLAYRTQLSHKSQKRATILNSSDLSVLYD